MISLTRVMCR